jgi:hypothetical protein
MRSGWSGYSTSSRMRGRAHRAHRRLPAQARSRAYVRVPDLCLTKWKRGNREGQDARSWRRSSISCGRAFGREVIDQAIRSGPAGRHLPRSRERA